MVSAFKLYFLKYCRGSTVMPFILKKACFYVISRMTSALIKFFFQQEQGQEDTLRTGRHLKNISTKNDQD